MNTRTNNPEGRRSRGLFRAVVILAATATVAVAALLINIFERKQEAKNPVYRVVEARGCHIRRPRPIRARSSRTRS